MQNTLLVLLVGLLSVQIIVLSPQIIRTNQLGLPHLDQPSKSNFTPANQSQTPKTEGEIKLQGLIATINTKEQTLYTINVKKVLEGPKPCTQEGLNVIISPIFVLSGLEKGDPVEVFGIYETDKEGCQVLLEEENHYIHYLTGGITTSTQQMEKKPEEKPSEEARPTKEELEEDFSEGRELGLRTIIILPISAKLCLSDHFAIQGGTSVSVAWVGLSWKFANYRIFDAYVGAGYIWGVETHYYGPPILPFVGAEISWSNNWSIYAELWTIIPLGGIVFYF